MMLDRDTPRASWFLGIAALLAVACTGQILGNEVSSDRSTNGPGGPGGPNDPGTDESGGMLSTPEAVAAACAEANGELQVGLTRLRRLTRRELEKTLFDLFGTQLSLSDTIAPDERIGPFHSNAIAPITDLIVEQYQELAIDIAAGARTRAAEFVSCDLAADGTCAQNLVATVGAKIYRRPLTSEEVTELASIYQVGAQAGGVEGGFGLLLEAMLQSPNFLYHSDASSVSAPSATPTPLAPHALASRLSYFLWGSMPDAALFAAADDGTLSNETVLAAQVERMLQDPRASEAVSLFHRQWLGFADVTEREKDSTLYPQYDAELAGAMLREADRFTDYVVRQGDGLLGTLLTSTVAFPEESLLPIYGVTPPQGFVAGSQLNLDATKRSGLLTRAAFLSRHAHGNQTSPVHRGIVVRENVLCQPIPPPPPNVAATPPPPTEVTSTRQRFEQHQSDPACAGCHVLIDPIGLLFEHYDPIGAYRETDGLGAVDASGELNSVRDDLAGTVNGAVELSAKLAGAAEVRDCVARQWFRFSLGRVESKNDACSVQDIQEAFTSSGGNVRALLGQIALSDAFRHVRGTGGDTP